MDGHTFKEIDARGGWPKGTAFRAFKRAGPALREGEDFVYLAARADAAAIERLRATGRIYASTVNAVVLTDAGLRRLEPLLGAQRR